MHRIGKCPDCELQFDTGDHPPGSRFHCLCGGVVTVPEAQPHDAAVVRCSSCGAPRTGDADACAHCGSDYTLHEQDLHTVCPTCTARISDRARFCHHCGTSIQIGWTAGDFTELGCPVCGPSHRLTSRSLGRDLTAMECERCVGMWLGHDAFEQLVKRSEEEAVGATTRPPKSAPPVHPQLRGNAPLYRKCVRCETVMNRTNYGKRSGVVVDVCREHGVWFDADELKRIIDWVRRGGLEQSRQRDRLYNREAAREAARPAPRAFNWGSALTRQWTTSFDLF